MSYTSSSFPLNYTRRQAKRVTDVWTVQYEANELPENATPIWATDFYPDPLVESVVEISPAGILHIVGAGVAGEVISYSINPNFVDATGLTVNVRLKMTSGDVLASASGEHNITIGTDETASAQIEFYTDGIRLAAGTNPTYSFDTTDDYHIYRITEKDHIFKVYVDGVLRLEQEQVLTGNQVNFEIWIVAGSVDTEQNWDYVYYRTDGAFAP